MTQYNHKLSTSNKSIQTQDERSGVFENDLQHGQPISIWRDKESLSYIDSIKRQKFTKGLHNSYSYCAGATRKIHTQCQKLDVLLQRNNEIKPARFSDSEINVSNEDSKMQADLPNPDIQLKAALS